MSLPNRYCKKTQQEEGHVRYTTTPPLLPPGKCASYTHLCLTGHEWSLTCCAKI